MMKYGFFFLCFLSSFLVMAQEKTWVMYDDLQKATAKQQETHQPILLVFSGSDWCVNCIKLDKNILSSQAFMTFAQKELILLNADFPQKKKLTMDQQQQNEKLADQYNPRGVFPHVVLLREHKKPVVVAVGGSDPQTFLQRIKSQL